MFKVHYNCYSYDYKDTFRFPSEYYDVWIDLGEGQGRLQNSYKEAIQSPKVDG